MLEAKYSLPLKQRKDDFEVTLPIDRTWFKEEKRLLIVLESVDSTDLKAGRLLSGRSKTVLSNILASAQKQATVLSNNTLHHYAKAVINFNNARTFHLETETERAPYHARFVKRVYAAIDKLKPTHLLICGDGAMQHLFPDVENSQWKRGWVHKLKHDSHRLRVTSTLDLENLYVPRRSLKEEDDDDGGDDFDRDDFGKCNLLGYVSRNIANCLLGRHAFSLKDLTPKPIYVDTLEKFKAFYAKLTEARWVAVDTETKNLSATKNSIYTIQFAFTSTTGYVIPLHHPQTPFSADEIAYISRRLAKWFIAEPEDHFSGLLCFNGKFDLRVIRAQFKLPIILRPVWEISSGEHELDENIKFLEDFGTPNGGLRATLTSYDNDLYWTMPFSKEERATIAFVDPSDQDFLNYAVLDVQCLIGIRQQQLAQAKLLRLGDKPFIHFYRNLVLKQMSNTVHTISHMEQRGVYIDGYYLARLKSKESPLVQSIDATKRELFAMPNVIKANQILLGANNSVSYTKGGLFNASSWVFNLNKPQHKITLFLEVMGLEPLTKTKTGQPQVDKNFQKTYQDKHREVKLFASYQETTKLWGTYIRGWYAKIKDSPDGSFDGRLRPSYGFFRVITGRLNSQEPSLQQVPSRGKLSKYVKRAFVSPPGSLYVKYDYSAHEVRFWGILAKDPVIADTFRAGQKLRQQYRKKPTPELAADIKKKGDVHIINIFHFFKKWVEKSDPLRDAIKAIVFGTIYQMSANSLAKSLRKQRVGELDDKVRSLRLRIKEVKAALGKI